MAPAGSDMQMLPPTVATSATLNDMSRAWAQARSKGAAVQSDGGEKSAMVPILAVAAISSPAAGAPSAGQVRPLRSTSVSMPGCGSDMSQVPPDSQAWPAGQSATSSALEGDLTCRTVFRSIRRSAFYALVPLVGRAEVGRVVRSRQKKSQVAPDHFPKPGQVNRLSETRQDFLKSPLENQPR